MKNTVALILGAIAIGSFGVLGAALAWDGESSAEAKADFCQSLDDFATTVESYEDLDPATASIEELDEAEDDIYAAYDEVIDDAGDWANAYDNPLSEAYDDLYWAIQDLPGDYTVAESLNELEPELSAFPAAVDEAFDGSGCSEV